MTVKKEVKREESLLPEWDKPVHCHCAERCACEQAVIRFREALTIAIKAMEDSITHGNCVNEFRVHLRQALTRIAALGDSEKGGKE